MHRSPSTEKLLNFTADVNQPQLIRELEYIRANTNGKVNGIASK